ncbi:unnamed protein product [Miscanthus lutarioriparius]|uniref:Uncharacterized protein n=1 Tax=Miscanthus lutarioriparius TaxID=422564 RepID=A0A811RK93_9POAL|nr:unnamed protein product [Miscanthus lutarioriparius]
MRASQHHAPPQPLPLPPPPLSLPSPPAAPRRGRHRSSHSSSSSSSSSSSISSSSTFFCPSPSPRASTTTSLVPFSWERHPGVPKNSFRGGLGSPTAGTPLPLPPPLLRPAPRRRRRRQRAKPPAASSSSDARDDDPFVAAFAECTREDDYTAEDADDDTKNKLWPVPVLPAKPAVVSSGRAGRRWWIGGGGGGLVAFLDMHGCKSAVDIVADGAFHPRRLVAAADPRPPVVRGTSR